MKKIILALLLLAVCAQADDKLQYFSGNMKVTNFPASQAVNGVFWQSVQPVSGAFWQATQPVSGTFWQQVQTVNPQSVASAVVTNLSVTNSNFITLLAARPARIKAILFNDNNTLYIKAGDKATNADYTWRAPANTQIDVTNYTGIITAVLNTAGPGTVHVTDF